MFFEGFVLFCHNKVIRLRNLMVRGFCICSTSHQKTNLAIPKNSNSYGPLRTTKITFHLKHKYDLKKHDISFEIKMSN